jgi:hypothetical protein
VPVFFNQTLDDRNISMLSSISSVHPKSLRTKYDCSVNYDKNASGQQFHQLVTQFINESCANLQDKNYKPNLCQCPEALIKAYRQCIYFLSNPCKGGMDKDDFEFGEDVFPIPFLRCCGIQITNHCDLTEHIYVKHKGRVCTINL